ncbi:hypothetical protein HANVADRAFT_53870 [Hanseniaspora valbyensis NRRL Y-1626]|uniref:GDP/GTP exchange factor Sec2 N-terminal domain-containing protein n=1 Tax=Hanseniaspora valbyensis NRRL Y-1626 TaxID=766949 RepID=A0A1B7T9X0_9ASCO|nr:hypothetical protein HANVADRAFT_53870 [Hanseniaspora valbyensis NRRL Y-1626]
MTDIASSDTTAPLSVIVDSTTNNVSTESFITTEEKERIETSLNDMSEQLMETMNKNQTLESQLIKLQETLSGYEAAKKKEFDILRQDVDKQTKLRETADTEAKGLREEISELSASLFEEANKMVALEKENSYNKEQEIKHLNLKLKEKDALEKDLMDQLASLKDILQDVTENNNGGDFKNASDSLSENDSKNTTSSTNFANNNNNNNDKILFSPFMSNIRFDTVFYQEFLKFLAVLPFSKDIYDTRTDSKLIKKILSQDVEPAIKLDYSKSLSWSHKKNLISWLISGEVLVEPISGLNETFKSNHKGKENSNNKISLDAKLFKFPIDSPPVAVPEPCSICNETRNDTLEHNRLYYMKLPSQSSKRDYHSYPLCHYCLLKIRSIGDIFSLLRGVKLGVWKLEKVSLIKQDGNNNSNSSEDKKSSVKEIPASSQESAGKRKRSLSRAAKRSSMISDAFNMFTVPQTSYEPSVKIDHKNEQEDEELGLNLANYSFTNVQLCYLELCRLRSKLYWADLGIWSLQDDGEDQYCATSIISPNDHSKTTKSAAEKHTMAVLTSGVSKTELLPETKREEEYKIVENVDEEKESIQEQQRVVSSNVLNNVIKEEEENNSNVDSGFDFEQNKSINTEKEQSQEEKEESQEKKMVLSPAKTETSDDSNGIFFDSYQEE